MANVSEELARLAQLRDQGVLSEDEFQVQKAAVLKGTPADAPTIAPEKKKSGAAKGCGILVLALIVLALIGMIAGGKGADSSTSAETAATVQPVAVTAQQLFAAYDANEAAAQQTYGDKPLLVTGTVAGVDLGVTNEPHVLLRTSNEFMNAQATLTEASEPQATGLSKGQSITLLCAKVSEVIGTPMLSECDIK
ncbi:SHOCT domain-containing protein [Sphingomonas sp. UV9]|uniref:OB-fold protein n=1 Tax=Sphingomonas sp. UV9 TaxID=1851410 RepID=UPI0019CF8F2B|nr:SHOCT domain-containing protein [Sphingomonas sp. UV9]